MQWYIWTSVRCLEVAQKPTKAVYYLGVECAIVIAQGLPFLAMHTGLVHELASMLLHHVTWMWLIMPPKDVY